MAIIYLDIETYSPKAPAIEDKVIAIGVGVNSKEKKYWEEWKHGEKEMIRNFYAFLKKFLNTGQTVWIIGFNIFKFDIPKLIYKVSEYNIMDVKDALKLWADCYIEDERQALLPTNQFKFKGLSVENVHNKLKEVFKSKAVRISELKYRGGEIAKFYEEKDYQKILDHLASDIDFLRDLHYILTQHYKRLL